jgi:rare lipoprotein A
MIILFCFLSMINIARAAEHDVIASWYKQGKITASGQKFNPYGLTVAHRKYPFGTVLRLTNMETNKSIIAIVNDRGPYVHGRTLDVSLGCALKLGMHEKGVVKLHVQKLG